MTGANVIEFAKEMGIGLSYWHVTDGGFASVGESSARLLCFATS